MRLVEVYQESLDVEDITPLRRGLALRAMIAEGMSQREMASSLGISPFAVSQQLKTLRDIGAIEPELMVEAAVPILTRVAEDRGYKRLAVFGSVARRDSRADSDIDLLVEPPVGTSIGDLLAVRELFSQIVGRPVDLVTYRGLKPQLDDDIRREAVLL
ncbi:nucleotidyltransferase domain-containing protein [Subtercola sp. YIM 133946]|uniref:nucleotidyltransferase domain-containing protein n=1 Tax=Subtercola sp. YIM 133946 TaxID=3118909 RepID=UPI002F940F6B